MSGRPLLRVFSVGTAILAGPLLANAATVNVPGNYPTIQAAINSVPDGTTIQVAAGTYPELLSVNSITTRSMTIRGVAGSTVVDAQGRGRPLTMINTTSQIVFDGVTFRNGAAGGGPGGGFLVQNSSPTFFNCIFENNTGHDGAGGALLRSNATFTNTVIRNNSAQHFGGGVFIIEGSRPVFSWSWILSNASGTVLTPDRVGAGGGVFAHDSSPTFRASHINGNRSKFASGGIHHQGVFGSGNGRAMLLVEDTEVADNVTTQFGPSDNPAEGGGIHIEDFATGTLTRARILRNIAATGGGLNAYRAQFDITDSVIDSNQSQSTPTGGFGGGISATSNLSSAGAPASIVNLTRSLIRNNSAVAGAGGAPGIAGGIVVLGDTASALKSTLVITDSVIDNNHSASQGGGMLVTNSNLTIANSLIIRNVTSGGAAPGGGGIRITENSTVTISGSTIARNTAAGNDGAIGGGIFISDSTSGDGNTLVNISGSNFYANSATGGTLGRGGALFLNGSAQGTINGNIIGDNASTLAGQIREDGCTSVTYGNNTIAPGPFSNQFSSPGNCVGGRQTGTGSANPRFSKFWAVPGSGTSTTLAWSVARATQVTIPGIGAFANDTGTVDVTPTTSATFAMTASAAPGDGGNYAQVTAGFTRVDPAAPGAPPFTGRRTAADFDGDGKSDVSVFRPSSGSWYIARSSGASGPGVTFGGNRDVPVARDYDGDGRADIAVFRPSSGQWYIAMSSNGSFASYVFGGNGDIPVVGDYDGDGKSDIGVFRPSTGQWFIGTGAAYVFGGDGDIPVVGDYDGDGKTDIGVFRPTTGAWYLGTGQTYTWGGNGDVPVPGDYDGDGKTDVAVFRPSTGGWYIIYSTSVSGVAITFGGQGDVPILKRP